MNSLPEISTTAQLPLLIDVADQYFTSTTPSITTNGNEILLGYTLEAGPRFITVRNEVNAKFNVGSVQEVDGSTVTTFQSPYIFEWNTSTTHKVQTPTALLDENNGKNKYRNWLNKQNNVQTEVATRRIQYNVRSEDEILTAKFDPAKRVQLSNILEGSLGGGTVTYNGITVADYDDYDFLDPIDAHPANTNVSNGTHNSNWTFWKWSDGVPTPSRNIVVSTNINLQAQYKGSQISDDTDAWNANQRKIVRTRDGWMHMVYESMGHIWYEAKAPGGAWQLIGQGGSANPLHLDAGGGRSPALDFNTKPTPWEDMVVIVWQEGASIQVRQYVYEPGLGTYASGPSTSIPTGQDASYDLQPNVGWSGRGEFMVLWRTGGGLNYRLYRSEAPLHLITTGTVTGSAGAAHPVISANKAVADTIATYFDVAWEQSVYIGPPYYTGRQIRYAALVYDEVDDIVQYPAQPDTVSTASGIHNRRLSIASMADGPRIAWQSDRDGQWDPWYTTAAMRNPWSAGVSTFDHHVQTVSVGKRYDDGEFYLAWSQIYDDPGWTDYNKFVKESAPGQTQFLNTQGRDVQLFEAPSANDMKLWAYDTDQEPYYWVGSNTLGSRLKQAPRTLRPSTSRGLALSNGPAGIRYAIGRVEAGGRRLNFVDSRKLTAPHRPDFKALLQGGRPTPGEPVSLAGLQKVLRTEAFPLEPGMAFSFEETCELVDSLSWAGRLSEGRTLTLRVELVDAATDSLLAVVRSMPVTGTNLRPQSRRWQVQPKGFASTTARLQITVETDFKELKPLLTHHYELIGEQQHQPLQAAQDEQLLVLRNQDEQPATYALQANYPNPFNPTTTIAYQLPERAEVSLKVYNLTGRLVQTLVQKSQQPGRYTVDFDASGLASGVYLYRLQAGDFSKVRRMLLIK